MNETETTFLQQLLYKNSGLRSLKRFEVVLKQEVNQSCFDILQHVLTAASEAARTVRANVVQCMFMKFCFTSTKMSLCITAVAGYFFLSSEFKLACMGTWENKLTKPLWIFLFFFFLMNAMVLQPCSKISPFLISVFSCHSLKFSNRLTFSMVCLQLNYFPGYF